MQEEVTTFNKTLYGKYRRELKVNNILCIISAIVLFILACVIFLNRFVLIKVCVVGESMLPTLQGGDIVSLNIYATPDYGDIIVIQNQKPASDDWIIKRVIALEGDTVKFDGGYVYLKKAGEKEFTRLDEPYVLDQGRTYYGKTVVVEEGHIFYLGDNRMNSRDSRAFGTCGRADIVGVVSKLAINLKGITTFLNNLSSDIAGVFARKG